MIAYNIVDSEQGLNIVLMVDGKVYQINDSTHTNLRGVLDALRTEDPKLLLTLITPANFRSYVEAAVQTGLEFTDGILTFNGKRLHNVIAKKIEKFATERVPYEYLIKFLKLMLKNPDEKSTDQLYEFLERNDLPINSDGYIIAYKGLHSDYRSIHQGRGTVEYVNGTSETNDYWHIPNTVGEVKTVRVPREYVDSDPNSACSYGLHVGSLEYVKGFARGRIILCAVSPEHVVSVPSDSEYMKIRVCEYDVVGDFHDEITTQVYEGEQPAAATASQSDKRIMAVKDTLRNRIANIKYARSQAYPEFNAAVRRVSAESKVPIKFVSQMLAPMDLGYGVAIRKSAIIEFLK